MKIPFLNTRIAKEFNIFLTELESSINTSVSQARAKDDKQLFAHLYPLFVLLRSLSNSDYVRDPVRDIVLSELRIASDKDKFLKAVAFFKRAHPYQTEFKSGMQRQIFTGYFQELFSDALLLLNSFYTNNYRGAQIALRCMLEDLYRHFYYRDHPQELWAISTGNRGEYEIGIRPVTLREYLKRTNYLEIFNLLNTEFKPKQTDDKTLFDINEELYSACSAAVHGSGDSDLNSFQSNLDFVFVPTKATILLRATQQFTEMAIAFLTSAHIDQFLAFSDYERSLILAKYSSSRRAALRMALNV